MSQAPFMETCLRNMSNLEETGRCLNLGGEPKGRKWESLIKLKCDTQELICFDKIDSRVTVVRQ